MRLRKTMKRTAAAVLALSMAVSAVAAPASAAYICDVSQGSVEVSVDSSGNKTIKVGDDSVTIKKDGTKETTGNGIKEDGDGTEDIVITGDNTKPTATESLNAEEENTSEAEKPGENTSEAEKSGENTSEGEGEGEDDEPTTQELLAPEDEQKKTEEQKDEQKPTETQETEQDKKPTDQVILYDQNDPEADKEATKLEAKPVVKQETEEKKAAEEKTYDEIETANSISEKVQEAARNVVKIINNSTEPLKVILKNLKVDAGDTAQNALTVSGTGAVTLELEGKNELKGGSKQTGGSDSRRGDGIHASERPDTYGYEEIIPEGKLTIQGKEGSSLSATGGSGTDYGGYGIRAEELELVDATVAATGGAGGYGIGVYASGDFNIEKSKLTAKGGGQLNPGDDASKGGGMGIYFNGNAIVGEGSEVIAIGGDDKATNRNAYGSDALGFSAKDVDIEVQKGGKLTAIGGNAESKKGSASGGSAIRGGVCGIVSSGETMFIGGNAKSESSYADGGIAILGKNGDQIKYVTVKGGTMTALGGKAESGVGKAYNGNSFMISENYEKLKLGVEESGTFITAKPGERDGKGNGIIGDVEIKTDGGKIEEMENAKVSKKEDGTVEVVGDLTGIKQDGHSYEVTVMDPTCTTPGKRIYTCTTKGHTDETYEEIISDALGHHFVEGVCTRCGAPEQAAAENSGSSAVTLTVTGAEAYETSIVDGRYVVAVPAEAAVLSGCLGNLKELKAQGVNTLVFRTQLRETTLNIDTMLSLGVDGTLFTLTHSGESAELTVGGVAHNELLH